MSVKWKGLDLWKDWLDRDDRKLLVELSDHQWSALYAWKLFSPWLHSIVESLHFGSHLGWGIQSTQKDIKILAHEFLEWMNSQGEWKVLSKNFAQNVEGPWTMPLFLARSYLRFKADRHPDWRNEKSISGQRQLLELPESGLASHDSFTWVSSPILDAFSSLTSRLSPEIRLIYQLHLEGLLIPEIAALLATSHENVSEHIAIAKGELTQDLKKGSIHE